MINLLFGISKFTIWHIKTIGKKHRAHKDTIIIVLIINTSHNNNSNNKNNN